MQKIRTLLCVVTTLAAATACNNPVTPGTDTGMSTADTGVPGTDSAIDTGRPDTGTGSGGTCATPINLNTAGTALATGVGRTIVANNTSTPTGHMASVANGSCADDGMGGSSATHETIFQYTVQTGGHLVASTDDPATTADLDTIVWILDGCSAGATELACDDDVGAATLTSRAVADATVTAGTTVFIVVAGYGGADVETGAFTLNVTELQPHAGGDACDATNFFCVDGFTCLRDAAGSDTGHCLADGGDNGLCRIATPFCDTGLQCSEPAPSVDNTGVCQMPIAGGAACTDTHFVCVPGFTCELDDGSTTAGHCLADGTEFGACRITGTACDTGLTCSNATPAAGNTGTCQTPIAAAGVCTTRHSVCVTGNSCQLDDGSDTMGHCLADGAEYGACRIAAPFCDGTLACGNPTPTAAEPGTCQMPIASGGVCTPRHYLCVANVTCIADAGSTTMGHCITDGAMGGVCRDAAPVCDGTLTCDTDGLCN